MIIDKTIWDIFDTTDGIRSSLFNSFLCHIHHAIGSKKSSGYSDTCYHLFNLITNTLLELRSPTNKYLKHG